MRVLLYAALCLLMAPFAASAHDYEHNAIYLSHPWIVEPPPGAPTAAGYLMITNDGEDGDHLVSVTADFAERAEIHTMTMTDDGIMQMRPHDGPLAVPAGGDVVLEPGGLHIMFMGLRQSLKDGDNHAVVLEFETGGEVVVEFTVQKRDGAMDMSHGDES
jgi:periplasmic copper chaperone A